MVMTSANAVRFPRGTALALSALAAGTVVVGCGLQRPGAHTTPSATQEAWDGDSDPMNLNPGFEANLDDLPASARSKKTPWPDTYWPSYLGGIANRWQAPYNQDQNTNWSYTPPTKAEIEAKPELVSSLSPAEKYDIYMGRFDYPTVAFERTKRTAANRPTWEGICHGWAPASKYFDEPKPFTATSKAGDTIKVPFSSSDVKALLTFYQGVISNAPAHNLGLRCNAKGAFSGLWDKACSRLNTNAGAFHIVLANTIGKKREVLLGNLTRRGEIWNFPMFAYETSLTPPQQVGLLGALRGFAPGTRSFTFATTTVWFMRESNPQPKPLVGTNLVNQVIDSKTYRYRLELDGGGNIIGGRWLGTEIPGFLWDQDKPTFKENDYYGHISELYSQSTGRAMYSPSFFTR